MATTMTGLPSRDKALPAAGTVPPPPRWVLIVHPGPWGPESATLSPLLPSSLRSAMRARGLRSALIRPSGHSDHPPEPEPQTCYLVCAGPDPFVERLRFADLAELAAGPVLDRLAAGLPSGEGQQVTEPLYLVCTQGERTPPCAQLGRPLARTLAALAGARAYESTHVGGCRHAPNLVCLPHGAYFSRLLPADLTGLVGLADTGRIALPHYRGLVGAPEYAQVAEAELRRRTGLDRFDAVRLLAATAQKRDRFDVEYATTAGRYRVVLRSGPPAPVCDGPAEATYEVVELHPLDG